MTDVLADWRLERRGEYSFLPFLKTSSLFVHIPKCAGVSICRALYGNLAGGHTMMRDYEMVFSPDEIRGFFTFSCVRNPWDRVLSAYEFLISGGFNATDAEWSDCHLRHYGSFERFVKEGLGKREIMSRPHFRRQTDFLQNGEGQITLDFLARFETIEHDFGVIRERVGGSALSIANRRRMGKRDFRHAFDPAMIEIVGAIYRADVDAFGYAFNA